MFEVTPNVSIGPLSFGMEYDEVKSILGIPVSEEENRFGEKVMRYDGFGVTVSDAGVVEAYFLPDTEVTISHIEIYKDPHAFQRLCALDGAPKKILGFIVLMKLGLTLTGFHDGDQSQQAITAFAKGRWDQESENFESYIR